MTSSVDPPVPGKALQDVAQKLTPSAFGALGEGGTSQRAELENARDAYKSEREQDAAQIAQGLVTRLRRLRNRDEDDDEILGSACTLLGLIKCRADDQAGARALFASAVKAFSRLPADRLAGTRGATAADYGIALQQTGDHLGAQAALRSALDLGMDTPDVRRHLGAALRDLGQPADADQILTDAVARAPLDWQATEWLAALHESLGNEAGEVGREWAKVGRLLREAGFLSRAARAYSRAVRLRPDDAELLLTAATVMAQSGAKPAASKMLLAGAELPMAAQARLSFAALLLGVEQYAAAAKAFRAVLETEPDNERAAVGLGWALIRKDDEAELDEAEQVLTQVMRAHPESVDAGALLGEIARFRDRYPEAIQLYDEALARTDDSGLASAFLHGSKGQALWSLGEPADALRELRRAAEIDPDLRWVHLELAGLYAESGDLDGQIGELRAALRLETDAEVLADLGVALARKARRLRAAGKGGEDLAAEALGLLQRVPAPDSYRPDVLRPLTGLLVDQGDESAALAVLDRAESALPGDLDVRGVRARVLYRTDRGDDAAKLLAANLAEDPTRLDDIARLAEIERIQGDLSATLEHFSRVIAAQPRDAWALSGRAAAYLDTGDLEAAEQDARLSLSIEPGDVFTLKVLRESLLGQDRSADAVEAFRSEAENGDASQELLREYAETLRRAGRFAAARNVLDDALWKNPQDVATRRALGWLLLDMYEPQEALSNFEMAAQVSPDDPTLKYEELTARILGGGYEEALECLSQWLDAHPDDGKARYLTGWLYYRTGAWQKALTAVRQAVRLTPDDLESRQLLGMAMLRTQDDPRSALQEFAELFRLAPENPRLRREYAQALSMAGRDDEARAAWTELLAMLRNEPGEDPEVAALKGWCLGNLDRLEEAVIEYRKALASTKWEPSVIAFGFALVQLIGGDEEGAADTLKGAWHFLGGEPPLRRRGIVASALVDLRIAKRLVPKLHESRIAEDAERRMENYHSGAE